jgi:hypothetical protein
MKRKSVWVLVLAVVGAAFYAGNVLATDPVGGFVGKTLAQATLPPLDIKGHTVVPADPSAGKTPASVWETMLKTKGDTDMYVQQTHGRSIRAPAELVRRHRRRGRPHRAKRDG